MRIIGAVLGAALLMLMAVGTFSHMISMRINPTYQMVDIDNGRRLHALCEGPENAPFILYDAGAFGIYTDGWWIKEALKSDHRVCLYDRAGMGWSDPLPRGTLPGPNWHMEDMRRLRAALGQDKPFLLIGHSMAGLRLHAYANTYPEELTGLVFVDAARPQTMNADRFERFVPWARRLMSASAILARIGVAGGASFLVPDELDLPRLQKRDKRRSIASVRHHKSTKAEIIAAFNTERDASWRTVTQAETLPVSVFSNSANGGANAPVAEAAKEQSGFGRVTRLPDESHVSLLNRLNAEKIAADVRAMTLEGDLQ